LALLASAAAGQVPVVSYRVETIPTPKGIAPEIGGITFAPDGRLAAAFRRGYIYLLDPANLRWEKFAEGLQSPLGIIPGKPDEFFVVHLPELTRIVDTDRDGEADLYETVSDSWGMSGNYHENSSTGRCGTNPAISISPWDPHRAGQSRGRRCAGS
jgi:hypothetical protein